MRSVVLRSMSGDPPSSDQTTDPRHYSVAETLQDGTAITIRAIRADDSVGVMKAFASLEPESIYTRFFSPRKGLTDIELKQYTDVDFDRVVALVVTTGGGDRETLIAGGRYVSTAAQPAASSAEVAFTTEEDYQGRGIAGRLLGHLVRSPGKRACHASRLMCSRKTRRCSPSFAAAAYRCNYSTKAASFM